MKTPITIDIIKSDADKFYIRLKKNNLLCNYEYIRKDKIVTITFPTIEGEELPIKTLPIYGRGFDKIDNFLQWVLNSDVI